MNAWLLAGVLLPAALAPPCAAAQGYPTKAIRMIVPFPPGGPNDILGRVVAQKLTEQVGTAPSILVTHPSLPVKAVRDVIALARAKPGQLNFASAGIGTPPHLAGELFKSMAGVDMVHVPYKGGGPALVDLIGGQVNMYFSGISAALPLVKDGKLRGIAVTSAKRTALMPDTPTNAEKLVSGEQ